MHKFVMGVDSIDPLAWVDLVRAFDSGIDNCSSSARVFLTQHTAYPRPLLPSKDESSGLSILQASCLQYP